MSLIIRNARIVTHHRPAVGARGIAGSLRGAAMDRVHVNALVDITILEGRITRIELSRAQPSSIAAPEPASTPDTTEIDAAGNAVVAGFVDCHTHACFAGDRLSEWDDKRRGVPYLDILARGGGIMSTVRSVRDATESTLVELLLQRLDIMLRCGSTTIEVKSGYGLDTATELKMLRAIHRASAAFPGTLVPTALLGHAIDDAVPSFVDRVINETLPAVASEFPGIAIDAYCETGAWSVAQCVELFTKARSLGLPFRVHADQFNALGMIEAAVSLGALSVDHLEASTDDGLRTLATSSAFGVALPICGVHLDQRFANARRLIDLGGALCIATNFNPGSAPCMSMCETIAMAVRHLKISPHEALAGATINPAALLGFNDRGTIEIGSRADLIILRSTDERALAFELGYPPIARVIVNGRPI
ncbi:MAG: imidazolonepropionase [Phycisphaerales bacterium]|nr:imidazolonepropionase [Phycisphaerales bacterium]